MPVFLRDNQDPLLGPRVFGGQHPVSSPRQPETTDVEVLARLLGGFVDSCDWADLLFHSLLLGATWWNSWCQGESIFTSCIIFAYNRLLLLDVASDGAARTTFLWTFGGLFVYFHSRTFSTVGVLAAAFGASTLLGVSCGHPDAIGALSKPIRGARLCGKSRCLCNLFCVLVFFGSDLCTFELFGLGR